MKLHYFAADALVRTAMLRFAGSAGRIMIIILLFLYSKPANAVRRYVDSANTSGTYNGVAWATAYNKLETALSAAASGDTLWVAKGTYQPVSGQSYVMKNGVAIFGGFMNTDTGFSQRNWAAGKTTLRGNNGRVVNNTFSSGTPLTATAVLDGFTITNGTLNGNGAGMYNLNASPTISNVIFLGNISSSASIASGGGMYNFNCFSTLTNVTFEGNKAVSTGNQAQGGAMYNTSSTVKMINVVFSRNRAESGTASNCYSMGGAIYNLSSTLLCNKIVFTRNVTQCGYAAAYRTYGGAVYQGGSGTNPTTYTNAVFSENQATWGQTFYNYSGAKNVITNATFANNAGPTGAPGYYGIYDNASTLRLTNCVFFNTASFNILSPVSYIVNNSYNVIAFSGSTGSGNLVSGVAPFMNYYNPEGPDGTWLTADDGLRLKNGLAISPVNAGVMVDTGTYTAAVAADAATDALGEARPAGGSYDMGAYEGGFNKITRYYVDSLNVTGTHDGLSWNTAFNKLEDIAAVAGGGDTVWVAKGTYQPASGASFAIPNGTAVYGGFTNTITAFNQRDRSCKSILAGNGSSVIRNDYTDRTTMSTTSMLEGFVIKGGNAVSGAGIYNSNASPVINAVIFQENNATGDGGGMYNTNGSSPLLISTVFYNNMAGGNGGAVYNNNSSAPAISNVTFYGNTAADGGAMYNNNASPKSLNCIFWNNTGTTPDIKSIGGSPGTSYCYAQSAPADTTCIQTTQSPFVNESLPAGQDGIWGTNDDGLRPDNGYAPTAVNTGRIITSFGPGDLAFTQAALDSTDITGAARYVTTSYDIGAYEFIAPAATRYYVDSSKVTGRRDGLSWATAFSKLEDAILEDGVGMGDSIWVAKGTYSPASGKCYTLKKGVGIYGGFLNTHTSFDQRQWEQYPVVLKGNNRSVFRNVFTNATKIDTTAVLDGFTITGGVDSSGGGMYNVYASPMLRNLIIAYDTARLYGGGGIMNSVSSPVLSNVQLIGNIAKEGGGMYLNTAAPVLRNVVISGNRALQVQYYGDGGGIYMWNNSSLTMNNVVFEKNTAANRGGGLFVQSEFNSMKVTNCIFYANTAKNGGGAHCQTLGSVKNTTFYKNISDSFGGGFNCPSIIGGPYPVLINMSNCIFWGNVSNNTIYHDKAASNVIRYFYSYLQSKAVNDSVTNMVGNATPFVNDSLPAGPDKKWFTTDDGLQLRYCSGAVNSGNNDSAAVITADVLGRPRIKNNVIDRGAYELQANTTAGQFGSNVSLSSGGANNLPLVSVCDDNGWTYYADPSRPDSLGFAINWGAGNNAAKLAASVYIKLDSNLSGAYTPSSGIWSMRRYWNVDLRGTTLSNPVQVRFYYNPADTVAMHSTAVAAGVAGPVGSIQWFKTTGTLFDPAQVSPSNINNGNRVLLQPDYGMDNNVAYVQFNGITSFSGGTAALTAGGAVPLPVKLLDLYAVKGGDAQSASVSWTVADEALDRYEVERSVDAAHFETAGYVKASGRSAYRFDDYLLNPAAVVYYRLKLVDAGGGDTYSKVVNVRFDSKGGMVSLYPNPAGSEVNLVNTNTALNGQDAVITDMTGLMIGKTTISAHTKLDVSEWLPGIYLVKIPDGRILKLIRK